MPDIRKPLAGAVALLLAVAPTPGAAAEEKPGRLHAVLVADTNDPRIGPIVAKDLDNVRAFLEEGFKDHPDRLTLTEVKGADCTWPAIEERIKGLKVEPRDAVLFYSSTHGSYASGLGQWLLMQPAPGGGRRSLPRSFIRQWALEKGARLTLVLTDACFELPDKEEIRAGAARPDWDTVRCLFLDAQGLLEVNAASEHELSYCNERVGSFYTTALLKTLRRPFKELDRDGDGFLHWQEVLPAAQQAAHAYYLPFRTGVIRQLKKKVDAGEANDEEKGFLGNLRAQPYQTARIWSLPSTARFGVLALDEGGRGALVAAVEAGTPAARAGLKPGDVLVEVGGTAVSSAAALRKLIDGARGEVEVTYQRGPEAEVQKRTVRLAPWPAVRFGE
jgi:hypothetical protein